MLDVCRRAIRTGGFVGGPEVEGFEREFAQFCDTKRCVAVNSGTDALRFALTAAGVQPGNVVLTVSHTFIATTEAISQAGARPDFVDIDERTFLMDPEKLRAAAVARGADVDVRMDSKLVVEQMSGRWQIKHPDMRPLAAQARQAAQALGRVTYTWVPRARNGHADRLANEAMDAGGARLRRAAPGANP